MKPRTVAIIQARMGSSRLPGKVLLPLGGRSILGYLVERLRGTRILDDIVVATTVNPDDDIIASECRRREILCFRGSEQDVLGRYLGAAAVSNADIIVRVTADNPFTDPDSIDRVVERILSTGAEYVIEDGLPVGTTGEAVTRRLLTRIGEVADQDRWREHVTLYAKENLSAAGGECLAPRPACADNDLSLTVDELSDYLRVREVAGQLDGLDFDLSTLIQQAQQLDANPDRLSS